MVNCLRNSSQSRRRSGRLGFERCGQPFMAHAGISIYHLVFGNVSKYMYSDWCFERNEGGMRCNPCPRGAYNLEWGLSPWIQRPKQDSVVHIIQRWYPMALRELRKQRDHWRMESHPKSPFLQALCRCCPPRSLPQPSCSVWLFGFSDS